MLEEYRKHVAERAAEGIAPKPLDANQMAALVELLKNPPAGEEEFLLDLLTNRVPPGVDEAAYVKAGFLAAVAKGEAKSPLLTPEKAIELLGTMQGGYNIHPLIDALDDAKLAPIAAKALSHTLLMFDNFYDVEEKAKAGNEYAKQVMQSWGFLPIGFLFVAQQVRHHQTCQDAKNNNHHHHFQQGKTCPWFLCAG